MSIKEKGDLQLIDDAPQVINADLRKFNKSEQTVLAAVTALTAITVIENKEQLDHAMEVLKDAKSVEKKIEEKRKELVKPFNDAVKKINTKAKDLVDKMPAAIEGCKNVVLAFQKAEQERVAKERREARELQLLEIGMEKSEALGFVFKTIRVDKYTIENFDAAQWDAMIGQIIEDMNFMLTQDRIQKQLEADDDAMFGTDDAAPEVIEAPAPVQIPTVNTFVSGAAKVKGVTKRWTFEITDLNQVPREYLQVNETAIREAVKAGTRAIPGVRIYQDESLTIR